MTALRISLPPDAVIRLDHVPDFAEPHLVVITPAALADVPVESLLVQRGRLVVAIVHQPAETWPSHGGVLLATAALEHGSAVLAFATREDATACMRRLVRERGS